MADERPMCTRRQWSKRQLRLNPELALFDRTDAVAASWTSFPHIRWALPMISGAIFVVLWLVACAAALVFCGYGFEMWGTSTLSQLALFGLLAVLLVSLPGAYFAGQFGSFLVHRRRTRVLRSELRRRGIPICIACGYEGGDIAAPKCPECGASAGV